MAELPVPASVTRLGGTVETPTATLYWMDWHGSDVLRLLHDGEVDCIVWDVTNSESFEKAKRFSTGRVLCVTGKHPTDEAVALSFADAERVMKPIIEDIVEGRL